MIKKSINKIIIGLICAAVLIPGLTINKSTKDSQVPTKPAAVENNKTFAGNTQSAKAILVEMDKRMNKDALQKVGMEVWEKGSKSEYFCTMKSKDNNQYLLLRYYSPERWADTSILMVKEDIWIYDHHSDRLLEVPRNLAFGGTDIAHGDMLRLNISKNYDGQIISEDNENWTLNLVTTNREMPYASIEIVMNKKGYYPVVAKCYSKSKKLIKTIEYSEIKELNGIMKPTKYTFKSQYEPDKVSVIQILDEKLVDYPESIFNKWVLSSREDEK